MLKKCAKSNDLNGELCLITIFEKKSSNRLTLHSNNVQEIGTQQPLSEQFFCFHNTSTQNMFSLTSQISFNLSTHFSIMKLHL